MIFALKFPRFFSLEDRLSIVLSSFKVAGPTRHGRSDPEKRRLYDMGEPVRCLDSCTVTERAEQSRAREGNHFLRNVAEFDLVK